MVAPHGDDLAVGERPDWLAPVGEPPALDDALARLRAAFAGYTGVGAFCTDCYEPGWVLEIERASRKANPAPQEFAQIWFEPVNCSGGVETIKHFVPRGLETCFWVRGSGGFIETVELFDRLLTADLLVWPDAEIDALRGVVGRLFVDWFERGECALGETAPVDAPHAGCPWSLDRGWPSERIVHAARAVRLDPADLVERLVACGTRQADAQLVKMVRGPVGLPAPFGSATGGCAAETSRALAAAITAREGRALLRHLTDAWFEDRFFRYEGSVPALATAVSDAQRDLPVHRIAIENVLLYEPDPPPTLEGVERV